MANIAYTLHFGYSEMLEMDLDDFLFFTQEANKILENS
jgi:hypothetical protein